MALEWVQAYILQPLIIISALVTIFFVFKFLISIRNKIYDKEIKDSMYGVFLLLAIGFMLWSIAEIIFGAFDLLGCATNVSIADLFWAVGYLLMTIAFVRFSVFMYRNHGKTARGIILMILSALVSGSLVFYMIKAFPIVGAESSIETFLGYFYPIASIFVLVPSISVYIFFRKSKEIGVPMIFLALANAFDFAGNILYAYYTGAEIYGVIGVISDLSFVVYYILAATGIYKIYKLGTYASKQNGKSKSD